MARETLDALAIRIAIASPIIGSNWIHVKSGGVYQITGVSIQESDGDLLYTYRPLDGPAQVRFTRPAFEFNQRVEGQALPRFVPERLGDVSYGDHRRIA